eukprot:522377_1
MGEVIRDQNEVNAQDKMKFLLSLLDFWRVNFRHSDFALLNKLRLIPLLETLMDSHLESNAVKQSSRDTVSHVAEMVFRCVCLVSLSKVEQQKELFERSSEMDDGRMMDPFQSSLLDCLKFRIGSSLNILIRLSIDPLAQTRSENTERHCFSLVSLLLMVASRSGTIRPELSSVAWLGGMMSCFVHPEAFSPRLLRHLHLCRLIIPLVSPTSVGEAMVSLDGEDLAAPVSTLWPRLDCAQAPSPGCDVPESAFRFADLLLRAIGFISCMTHLPSLVSQLPSKKR